MLSNFKEWTLDKIDEAFGIRQVKTLPVLEQLISFVYQPSAYEIQYLTDLSEQYLLGGDDWNETELENKFISPLIVFSKIDNEKFAYFLERELSVALGNYELSGKVDGMIATGFRNPKKPFFFVLMNTNARLTQMVTLVDKSSLPCWQPRP